MASKYMKKCSNSLVIKEMQMKTTLRFHLTLVRMTIFKSNNNNKSGEDAAKQDPLYTVGKNATTMESSMESPQKAKDRTAV
jgi:hypothetical protein